MIPAEDWRADANCKEIPTDIFFPERGEEIPDVVREVCAACTVRMQCLDFAVANKEPGFWGGTAERTRRKLRREAARDGRVFDRRLGAGRGRVWSEAS